MAGSRQREKSAEARGAGSDLGFLHGVGDAGDDQSQEAKEIVPTVTSTKSREQIAKGLSHGNHASEEQFD